MDGVAIFVVAVLILLCVAGLLYTIGQLIELEAMPTRRQVERTIIPADWDRIMEETTLEKKGGKRK
jgi:uncharacterized iron-regulated membrane protein